MAGNRREFNRQETIRHIRTVFLELYANEGINSITIRKLCDACGIARATFYLYYPDKYAVLEEIEADLLAGLNEITHQMTAQQLIQIRSGQPTVCAEEMFRFLREHANEFRSLIGKNGDSSFVFRWKKDLAHVFMVQLEAGQYHGNKAELACEIACSAAIGLYRFYLSNCGDLTEREFSLILGNLMNYALWNL